MLNLQFFGNLMGRNNYSKTPYWPVQKIFLNIFNPGESTLYYNLWRQS